MAQTKVHDIVAELELSDVEAEALIAEYVRQDGQHPGRHQAGVESSERRVQIWRILPFLRVSGITRVAEVYGLPDSAMKAAVAYYRRHRRLFDAKIMIEREEREAS